MIKYFFTGILILALAGAVPATAALVIENVTFHDSTNIGYDGNNPDDDGGALFIQVRNDGNGTGNVGLTSENCQINGQPVTSIMTEGPDAPTPGWVRVWPEQIGPGEVATWVVKTFGGTVSEGATLSSIQVSSDGGAQATATNITLNTPKLRLAHVVPSQDWREVWVFIRNDDTTPITVDELVLNDDVTARTEFVGGATVAPGALLIAKVGYDSPVPPFTPLAIRASGVRQAGGARVTVGSFIRLTEPEYGITTWGSTPSNEEHRVQRLRQLYGLTGNSWGGTRRFMETKANRYFYRQRVLDILDMNDETTVDFSRAEEIDDLKGTGRVGAWFIEDEPDLNYDDANRNPRAMKNLGLAYWRLDPGTSTHVNLVSSRSAQAYALTVDHPAIDCYMQYAPRHWGNIIFQNFDIDEALDQTENLKRVSEPLRFWMTPQGVSPGTWDTQPTPWGIGIQFWAQVMGGAKGLDGFKFDDTAGGGSDPDGERTQRIIDCIRQLRLVEGLLLYGDPVASVATNKPEDDLAARMIVSENQVVVGAVNLEASHPRTFGLWGNPSKSDQTGVDLTIQVPGWMPVEQVVEVTPGGFQPVSHTVNGQTVQINGLEVVDRRIFMIGALDTTPPAVPTGLQVAPDLNNTGGLILSWKQPFDAVGIAGYKVFIDGEEVATVPTPLATIPGDQPANAHYAVQAFDGAGNLSPFGYDTPTTAAGRGAALYR